MKIITKYKVPSYTKPTDTNQFCMPCLAIKELMKSRLCNQAQSRLKRVCSNENDLKLILIDVEYMLINRDTQQKH